jgi:hypothetical protein
MLKQIKCKPGDLDNIKELFDNFLYFTIGERGKAQYHYLYLANHSCGIYYAVRVNEEGFLEGRRAIEPSQIIICHGEVNI